MKQSVTLSLLLVFILPFFTYSQNNNGYLELKQLSPTNINHNELFFFCRKTNIDDSATENHFAWKESTLLTTTNDTFAIKARFDPKHEDIEILIDDDSYVLFKEKTQAILIDKKVYIASEYPEKDQLFYAYFELLSEGSNSLLLKDSITFYYKIEDKPATILNKPSKKKICAIFEDRHKTFEAFIRSNKINLKKKEDLIRVFDFMNKEEKLESGIKN